MHRDLRYASANKPGVFSMPTAASMRLTCWLFGREVFALDLGPATAAADEADPLRDLGTLAAYPITWTGNYGTPEEAPMPQRTPAWDEPDE